MVKKTDTYTFNPKYGLFGVAEVAEVAGAVGGLRSAVDLWLARWRGVAPDRPD